MQNSDEPLIAKDLKSGTTQSTNDLHITGGVRAGWAGERLWRWWPTLKDGRLARLRPLPIQAIDQLATNLGARLFGGDDISGLEGPLVSRNWRPLDGPSDGGLTASDKWRLIFAEADRQGDAKYSNLAANIAFSLSAAGIRLRDASDHYNNQLMAALQGGRKPGGRFANVPMKDLQLAFHSVLSELGSARDYLAWSVAYKAGAPDRIDALNRFVDWVGASSRSHLRSQPLIDQMVSASSPDNHDPWLWDISEYRNLFLHRSPIGARWLRYDEGEWGQLRYPRIEFPLPDDDHSAPGVDALIRFVELYRRMVKLLDLAADHAPFEPRMQTIVAEPSR